RTKPNIQGGSSPNTNQRSFGVPRDATSPDGSFQRDSASSSLLAPRHHVGGKDVNSDRCASRPSPRTRRNTASSSSASASLMAEPTRVRVEFEDHRRLLTKSQRKDGLRRCWILLGPHLPTVADLAAHLARSFALHRSCPRGIRLFMDEFVLPPFESTSIFRDKDIIRNYEIHWHKCRKDEPIDSIASWPPITTPCFFYSRVRKKAGKQRQLLGTYLTMNSRTNKRKKREGGCDFQQNTTNIHAI
ncbi:hypothetical protein MUK42_30039, partial [Musa troglodytarum]